MSSFNNLERKVARVLGRFPVLKRMIKSVYGRVIFLSSKKNFKYWALKEPVLVDFAQGESFFGYYDKSPENRSGLVLSQSAQNASYKIPQSKSVLDITVFDRDKKVILEMNTRAYNWQQGCRAHWLTDDLVIYNDFDEARCIYTSNVYSICSKELVKVFDYPVQDTFSTEYFISLNYRRLMALRPDYGYRNLPALSRDELVDLKDDGLWRVEYESGEARLLISLAEVCAVNPAPEFEHATHKFNHVMISPDGLRFIVMHRYVIGQRRSDRLLLGDSGTGEMRLLSEYGMVSHFFWLDSNTVLGYMRGPHGKDGYWLVDVESGEFQQCLHDKLGRYGDGHPHVHGDWFVTDTYPDKARMQHLLLCNWKTGEVQELGQFFHGFEFSGETRCDLHPRFSPDGKSIYFDSVFSGKRQLYCMDLSQ